EGAIFQGGEAEGAVGQPGHHFGVADERNGSAVPVVPQGPATAVVQFETQPAEAWGAPRLRRPDQAARNRTGEENERASVHGHNVGGPRRFVYAARRAGDARPDLDARARLHG